MMKKNTLAILAVVCLLVLIAVAIFWINRAGLQKENAKKEMPPMSEFDQRINANAVAFHVLGDLNGDRKVTSDDIMILQQYVATGNTTDSCHCLAAGDWSGNSEVNEKDLSIAEGVFENGNDFIPLLAAESKLLCDYSKPLLYATAYVMNGEQATIQFPDESKNISVTPLNDTLNIVYDTVLRGYTVSNGITKKDLRQMRVLISITDSIEEIQQYDLDIPEISDNDIEQEGEEIDTPTLIYGHEDIDCPFRHKGCQVLIVDFLENNSFIQKSAKNLIQPFKDCGCNVIYTAPTFIALPKAQTIYGHGWVHTIPVDSDEVKRVLAANDAEEKKMNDAIKSHLLKLRDSCEVAIEIVNAHGSDTSKAYHINGQSRSWWSTGELTGKGLFRSDFLYDNYFGVDGRCCAWFTFDISCFAGFTPIIVDNLENIFSTTECQLNQDGDWHAPWELCFSFGTSSAENSTTNYRSFMTLWELSSVASDVADFMKEQAAKGKPETDHMTLIDRLSSSSYLNKFALYSDKGYARCKPHQHARSGR